MSITDFDDIQRRVAISRRRIENFKEKEQIDLQLLIAGLFDPVFKDRSIEGFSWEQFTPHFNDGNECYFRRYEIRIKHKDPVETLYDLEDDYGFIASWELEEDKKDHNSILNAIILAEGLVGAIAKEDLQFIFGDGVRVFVNRDGFEIVEIDHH